MESGVIAWYRFKGSLTSGFTLLEVMISVAVIAIALVAALGAQSRNLSLTDEGRFNTTAALLGQGKMAQTTAGGMHAPVSTSGDFGEDFPEYHWEVSVEKVHWAGPEALLERLRRVDVVVSHKGGAPAEPYRLRLYAFVTEGF